jgi:hypothetical protein
MQFKIYKGFNGDFRIMLCNKDNSYNCYLNNNVITQSFNITLVEIVHNVRLCNGYFERVDTSTIPFFKTHDDAEKFIEYLESYLIMQKLIG